MKKYLFSALAIACSAAAFAQQENLSNSTKPIHAEEPPVDGYFVQSDIENRKVIPYATIRQTDVAYKKKSVAGD